MSPRTTLILVSLTLAGAACAADRNGPDLPPAASALDSVLLEARAAAGLPAMAAIVVRADTTLAIGAVGVRKQGGHAAVSTADRFHLGSNVKAMTATMIATLVEEGALHWATRPVDVFPELAGEINPAFGQVTLEQLLQHRAGIEPLLYFGDVPPFAGTPAEQRYQGTALVLGLDPAGPVGEFLYSNAGYAVAAAMAERVTGSPWEQLMTERLFAPLGITPLFGWPAAATAGAPWGHAPQGNRLVPLDPMAPTMPAAIDPAGEQSLTLEAYARFAQLHLRGLAGRPSLVGTPTYARLHAPVGDYALGWGVVDFAGEMTSTHNGSTGAFYATVFLQPGRDLAVIVVSNAGGDTAAAATVGAGIELLRRYGGAVPGAAVAARLAAR
ncbi:MAG: beta-lactamase family protein [Gemmatimonadetes bacterium]|nr:beta-lactamase family protein [Gemmatimonadota bacterium]